MSSKPASGVLASSSLRLSLLYAALLAAAFAATAAIVWRNATRAAEADLRRKITLEVDAICQELKAEGLDGVVGAIAARMERPGAPDYWLSDAKGARLIGGIPALEGPNGWRTIVLQGEDGPEGLLVLTRSFPSGERLSVGEDLEGPKRTINQTMAILAEVGAFSVMLVLFAGYLLTRQSLRRLSDMTDAFLKIGGGDLAARIPIRADIFSTDLDRIGADINRMLDSNEQLVDGLRRVSRDVAHDLRTPLSHLRQALESARAAAGDAKDREIETAQDKADSILTTFDAILRLSEIEAGAAKARFAMVDLAEVAETIADAYRPDIEQAGRLLRLEIEGTARVNGDRDLLLQAIANLIENGVRHSLAGAAITIAVGTAPSSIAVMDEGGGVAADMLEEIKKPFVRLDASRSSKGSGLGLSIANAIARLHDAALDLENLDGGFRARLRFGEPTRDSSLKSDALSQLT